MGRRIDLNNEVLSNYMVSSSPLISRTKSILSTWRQNLSRGDKVCAPDYFDEYDFPEEKWVKLYEATIINQKSSGTVHLGDSSLEKKIPHKLGKGEAGILVHYDGFPKWQKQWLLRDNELIMPRG